MEEDEYRATYSEIAANRCVFEKALTNNQARCRCSRHFWLADREGYACQTAELSGICRNLLEKLRENARFSLKLPSVGTHLPHNMEIRVQVGGLRGLRLALEGEAGDAPVADIRGLVETAEQRYQGMDAIPYGEVVQSIARYEGRGRRRRGGKQD